MSELKNNNESGILYRINNPTNYGPVYGISHIPKTKEKHFISTFLGENSVWAKNGTLVVLMDKEEKDWCRVMMPNCKIAHFQNYYLEKIE